MKFRLPRKLKKFLKNRDIWVNKETGNVTYPWGSQLDYRRYKTGELAPFSFYVGPTH